MTRCGEPIWGRMPMLLEARGLKAGYGPAQVLFGVDLHVDAGECVTLLGRNGMGKTTTVKVLTGLLPARCGSIRLTGRNITRLPAHARARLGLGLVPEGRQIFPNLTVRENLVATARPPADGSRGGWTLERVQALFPELAERSTAMGSLLSGGEQQMLAIGRALMTNPRLLILDEATEGLAPLVRARIWKALEEVRACGMSLLIIDKNVQDLLRIASRHIMLEKGRIVWTGSSEELARAKDVREKYLGV